MITKLFEVRDAATTMPVLAIKLAPADPTEYYMLRRAGYGSSMPEMANYVAVWPLSGGSGKMTSDPYEHGGARTLLVAHQFLNRYFDRLTSGDVIDVEWILGLSNQEKESELLPAKTLFRPSAGDLIQFRKEMQSCLK